MSINTTQNFSSFSFRGLLQQVITELNNPENSKVGALPQKNLTASSSGKIVAGAFAILMLSTCVGVSCLARRQHIANQKAAAEEAALSDFKFTDAIATITIINNPNNSTNPLNTNNLGNLNNPPADDQV